MEDDSVSQETEVPEPSMQAQVQRSSRWQQMQNNRLFWQGKFVPAFWTISGLISLAVNVILVVILLILARELFNLKGLISNQLIGGLYENFVKMEQAVIETSVMVDSTIPVVNTIAVNDTIPVQFILPLEQETIVTLTESLELSGVPVTINIPGLFINAPADIILPAGTDLPVALNMDVPVDQTIPISLSVPISITVPVQLEVPVSIPLRETQLQEPFIGLQNVVAPYDSLLGQTPDSWSEAACRSGVLLCMLFGEP